MIEYTPDAADMRIVFGDGSRDQVAEFDRWLKAHDAAVLEKAADDFRSGQLTGIFMGRDDYTKAWLRARAKATTTGQEVTP